LTPSQHSILVAEDNYILRYTTVRTLSTRGYNVIEACDGADALRAAAKYDGAIHLLITDVQMPNMNGHDLAREIKIKRPDILVMIVSGEDEPDFPLDACNYADVLLKPATPGMLLSKVNALLQGGSSDAD
jgi:DNA-binding response OmpR family regulator